MSSTPVLLSILIPTLVSRQALFARLHAEIERQVEQAAAHAAVEILSAADDGTESVGAKRNRLLARASGRFTVFIDDDDHISQDYIHRVLRAIHDHPTADCISYAGEIRFRGAHPRRLVLGHEQPVEREHETGEGHVPLQRQERVKHRSEQDAV